MYGIFSPQNVRGRGVSLVREGQNSLWADGFLCLLGNAQGMCLGGDGCSFSCVIRFLDGEHRFRNPKQKKARLTQRRVCDCAERGLGSPTVEQTVPAAFQPGWGIAAPRSPLSFLYRRMVGLLCLPDLSELVALSWFVPEDSGETGMQSKGLELFQETWFSSPPSCPIIGRFKASGSWSLSTGLWPASITWDTR